MTVLLVGIKGSRISMDFPHATKNGNGPSFRLLPYGDDQLINIVLICSKIISAACVSSFC